MWNWAEATFENWQSEFLQLFAMVVLTSFLIFRGSSESKDGDDEMKAVLGRVERRLDDLAGQGRGVASLPRANGARQDRVAPVSGD